MYYSGIDLHKRFSYITTVDEDGKVVKQSKLSNTNYEILNYFRDIAFDKSGGFVKDHRAVVESSTGWYWLSDLFAAHRLPLVVAHAKYVKAIAYAKVKTDKVDSHIMAQLLRMDFIPEAYQIAPELRDLRDTMRSRLTLVQKQTACSNHIHRLLEKFNLDDPNTLPSFYFLQYRLYRQQLDLLGEQITILEKSLHPKLVPNIDVQRLLWIPGIGKINAFSICLEVGDINRFESEKPFYSYCRLVPGADNSGGKLRHKSGNKAGNKYLKLAFTDAAVHAVRFYPVIAKFYQRNCRKKHKLIALNLVSKEIAKMVYHVLKDQSDFNGKFKGQPLQRRKSPQWPRLANPNISLVQ